MRPEENGGNTYGQGIYTPELTQKTYATMLKFAERDLQRLTGVVLDGSYTDQRQRELVRDLAERTTSDLFFIYCHCDEEETKRRLQQRARDPHAVSDGRWDIFVKQREKFSFPQELKSRELIVLDTHESVDALLDRIESKVGPAPADGMA